jgi:hypothetical protein
MPVSGYAFMAKVQHYKGLGTNLESLYDSIKAELESEKIYR